jgi:hypothetical protein
MENFNLKEFLIENKLTSNSKILSESKQLTLQKQEVVDDASNSENEGIGEFALRAISILLAAGTITVVRFAGGMLIDSIISGLYNIGNQIKNIIAPPKLHMFAKIIGNDAKFNKDFLQLLILAKSKRTPMGLFSTFGTEVTELPSFQEKFSEFVKQNKITDTDAEHILSEIQRAIMSTVRRDAEEIIANIKKNFPEIEDSIE